MGGSVGIESKVGEGTTFIVKLKTNCKYISWKIARSQTKMLSNNYNGYQLILQKYNEHGQSVVVQNNMNSESIKQMEESLENNVIKNIMVQNKIHLKQW